jgi:NAD(P)-dependent dehydrogenase (short-subunit alcohol dehydrogenase family)
MAELSGRTALVTGSSSGIGEAIARRLGSLGAEVVINSASSTEA